MESHPALPPRAGGGTERPGLAGALNPGMELRSVPPRLPAFSGPEPQPGFSGIACPEVPGKLEEGAPSLPWESGVTRLSREPLPRPPRTRHLPRVSETAGGHACLFPFLGVPRTGVCVSAPVFLKNQPGSFRPVWLWRAGWKS